jgi:hypothetical protein
MKDLRRQDINFRQKLMYLFGPPGWSHDGRSMTSSAMRLQEEIENNNASSTDQGDHHLTR